MASLRVKALVIRITGMLLRLSKLSIVAVLLLLLGAFARADVSIPGDEKDRARAFTRSIEFDYISWMADAAGVKARTAAAGVPGYLGRAEGRIVVSDYLQLTEKIIRAENALNRVYADPGLVDKEAAAARIRERLNLSYDQHKRLAALAEAVLQSQVAEVVSDFGLGTLGQPFPAVLFHATAVPDALIVSPRNEIRQVANISIQVGLPLEQLTELEQRVEAGINASALVVPVGGVGVYPTMVMRTTDRRWLASTIAHEWTHNYLEFRPLGLLYDHTSELRTMNETTADIVGTEVGNEVIRRYYDGKAFLSPEVELVAFPDDYPDPGDADLPPFDFRREMHRTRVVVDLLLGSGRMIEAEQYMEARRRLFVQNGYIIRRLNQAYFAFYGAYAETPVGPAGQDPVGPAVRELRSRSASLGEFVNRISRMTSFEQLREAVGR